MTWSDWSALCSAWSRVGLITKLHSSDQLGIAMLFLLHLIIAEVVIITTIDLFFLPLAFLCENTATLYLR